MIVLASFRLVFPSVQEYIIKNRREQRSMRDREKVQYPVILLITHHYYLINFVNKN